MTQVLEYKLKYIWIYSISKFGYTLLIYQRQFK